MALIEPHGGTLRVLYLPSEEAAAFKLEAAGYPSWDLSQRQLCDLKLLLNGGFSPLAGFLGEQDYEQVLERMRLGDGTLWPIPVTLDVARKFVDGMRAGQRIGLRDPEGFLIATMTVESIWEPDRRREAQAVFGTTDEAHPGVDYLLNQTHPVYLGGPPRRHRPPGGVRLHPAARRPAGPARQIQALGLAARGGVPDAQPDAPRAQGADPARCPDRGGKPSDPPRRRPDQARRRRSFRASALLRAGAQDLSRADHAAQPAAARHAHGRAARSGVAPPSSARTFGCTHFIVGRDHAGPGNDRSGKPFYGPYDAQALLQQVQGEIGIQMVPFKEMAYVQDRGQYVPQDEVRPGETLLSLSGTEFRRRLREGIDIPAWFSYPEVVEELRRRYPPKHRQGFTVLFTGLSGAGKSTLANALMIKLLELGGRSVTLLDGDLVRKHLSSELGFSKEHRDLNILRIGFVASEITKAGGVAICAPIAPYATIRRRVREMVEAYGTFVEIYVATPLEVCEQRDTKGLYAKARAGLLSHFTGIDDRTSRPRLRTW